jgi:hypothetical protein
MTNAHIVISVAEHIDKRLRNKRVCILTAPAALIKRHQPRPHHDRVWKAELAQSSQQQRPLPAVNQSEPCRGRFHFVTRVYPRVS